MVAQHTAAQQQPDWQTREQTRLAVYQEARDFYDGQQWLGRAMRGETRLTVNYARALIRKAASYTLPSPTGFSIVANEDQAAPIEQLLTNYLQEHSAQELDMALLIEASTLGDAAIKVTWDNAEGCPIMGQVDPATLAAWWDPTHPSRLFRIEQRYQLPPAAIAASTAIDISALNPDQLYQICETWTNTDWSIEVAGQIVVKEKNPYGWIPYVVLANERPPRSFWGSSDLTDLYDVCRELNARLSTLSRIMELSGAPIAVLENVDGSEGITVGPGAKWEIPEGAKAYLLDLLQGNGVSLHIENLQQLARAMHDLSETPRTAFGDSGRTLSGAALEVEIQPLVQKVRRKRSALERFYTARNKRILDLLERFGGEPIAGNHQTKPIWAQILPSDEDAAVRNQVQLVAAQISSRKRAAEQLGNDDPEAELAQITAELAALAAAAPAPAPLPQQTEKNGNGN